VSKDELQNSDRTRKTISVVQGECRVSDCPEIEMTTLLGSCVATCMCDPVAGVGGMNHFLLPYARSAAVSSERYGLHAMEVLINGLLKLGARKPRLQAKVFGGAMMGDVANSIGQQNAAFALSFLDDEGIPCIANSIGGLMARRLKYAPTTGRARQLFVREFDPGNTQCSHKADVKDDIQFFDGGRR